jgi:hypothetical protein
MFLVSRLSKALEEVYRKMAFQDFRRRRDRLAADCVRLGKIVSMRTVCGSYLLACFARSPNLFLSTISRSVVLLMLKNIFTNALSCCSAA